MRKMFPVHVLAIINKIQHSYYVKRRHGVG